MENNNRTTILILTKCIMTIGNIYLIDTGDVSACCILDQTYAMNTGRFLMTLTGHIYKTHIRKLIYPHIHVFKDILVFSDALP